MRILYLVVMILCLHESQTFPFLSENIHISDNQNSSRIYKRQAVENSKFNGGIKGVRNMHQKTIEITERYPPSVVPGDRPNIILTPGGKFNFNCSSREEWVVCKWKTPVDTSPCIITNKKDQETCGRGFGDFSVQQSNNGRLKTCSIKGTLDAKLSLEGNWSCDLNSINHQDDTYYDAQDFFNLELVHVPRVRFSSDKLSSKKPDLGPGLGQTTQIYENEEIEFTCEADNGYPAPSLEWLLNEQPIDFRANDQFTIEETDGPRKTSSYNKFFYIQETIRYTASVEENNKKISCRSRQKDNEDNTIYSNRNENTDSIFLFVSPQPNIPNEPISTQMIVGVVSIIILVLLVLFVVGFLFYTKKFCFATPIVTLAHVESKETGEMIIQTDPAFNKLISGGVSTETEPLIGQAFHTQTDLGDTEPDIGKEKECDFSVEQTIEFCYEGSGSLAGSLSSLGSHTKSIDLVDQFSALGHPFAKLSEIYAYVDVSGDESDSDDDSEIDADDYTDDLDSIKLIDEQTSLSSEAGVSLLIK